MTLILLSPAFQISCRIFEHSQPPPSDRLNDLTANLGHFSSFVNSFPWKKSNEGLVRLMLH